MEPSKALEELRDLAFRWDEWGHLAQDPMYAMDHFVYLFTQLDNSITSGDFRLDDWS